MTEYLPYRNSCWSGFISRKLKDMDLSPEKLAVQGEVIVNKPNRMVRRIELPGTTVYAKWFAPPKNIFKRWFRKPLAFRLLDIHRAMLASGIGCATPFLAAISSRPFEKTAQVFVYKEVPYQDITHRLLKASDEEAERLYLIAAQAVAALHNAGFVHGDCLPGNICLSDEGQFYFIDNDRTASSLPFLRAYQERRNLIQFCAHALHQHSMSPEQQKLFLKRYFECRSQKLPKLEPLLDRIDTRFQEIQREKSQTT
ncbi:MAG: hypothetical protein IKP00_09710 [Victivallales bacterium]|nr:hypothetical protein [Victivallales bacterium]